MAAFVLNIIANEEANINVINEAPNVRIQHTKERHLIREFRLIENLNDALFKENFRVNKHAFEILYNELGGRLKQGQTKYAITIETKLLLTLRQLAQGSYQRGVGNDTLISVSKASVSRILNEVLDAMNGDFCEKFITFPNFERMQAVSERFLTADGMPNVIGLIDGTHIPIVALKNDPQFPEFIYVNRKQTHSINALVIGDYDYRIIYINARYPGSSHDSFIWRYSAIREYMNQTYGNEQLWLLGDSGFPLEPTLLTPYKTAQTPGQILFNTHHKKCRSRIERCIGVLKARWRCLKDERGLHYHPTVAGKIVNACAALHNFCIINVEDYLNGELAAEDDVHIGGVGVMDAELHARGEENRQHVIHYLENHPHPN